MENDPQILLRQYELMVNTSLQVTGWRQTTNNFFLAVNTTLLAITAYLFGSDTKVGLVICFIGVAIAVLWHQTIEYFCKLNSAKFKVIHHIEQKLPVKMFKMEYEHYKKETAKDATHIEKCIPYLFGLAYLLAIVIEILKLLGYISI